MRKFILIGAVMALLVSCRVNEVNNGSATSIPLVTNNEVGRLHNEGLDYVFGKIKGEIQATRGGRSAITEDFVDDACWEFLEKEGIVSEATRSTDWSVMTKSRNTTPEEIGASPLMTEYTKRIARVLARKSNAENIDKLHNQFLSIEQDILADTELDTDEREALLSMTAVTVYSVAYWQENYDDWMNALGVPEVKTRNSERGSSNWGDVADIAWADAGGAMVGAMVGAAAGGVGAGPGALGGGLGASAFDAWMKGRWW